MATFGCTERHARRILSEGGKEYALEMRELQAEKMRLQIRRIEIWLKDSAEKYIHVDEYARQKKAVVEIVREAMDKLTARLLRELPGRTAAEMAQLIEEAGDDARREMARMADENLKREGIE
jgi:galactokinase